MPFCHNHPDERYNINLDDDIVQGCFLLTKKFPALQSGILQSQTRFQNTKLLLTGMRKTVLCRYDECFACFLKKLMHRYIRSDNAMVHMTQMIKRIESIILDQHFSVMANRRCYLFFYTTIFIGGNRNV